MTIANLVQESQSLIIGDVFNSMLKELAEIRDNQRKPLLNKDIENVFIKKILQIKFYYFSFLKLLFHILD